MTEEREPEGAAPGERYAPPEEAPAGRTAAPEGGQVEEAPDDGTDDDTDEGEPSA